MKYLLFLLVSCAYKYPKTDIHIWIPDNIDQSVCEKTPELENYGMYRVITCTDQSTSLCAPGVGEYEEFMPYCSPQIKQMLGVDSEELFQLLKDRAKNNPL